jgi:hypothetical protein
MWIDHMDKSDKSVKELTIREFKDLIHATVKEALEDELEDYLALRSEEYVKSIREARKEYKSGNVKNFDELFPDV